MLASCQKLWNLAKILFFLVQRSVGPCIFVGLFRNDQASDAWVFFLGQNFVTDQPGLAAIWPTSNDFGGVSIINIWQFFQLGYAG